MHSFAAVTARNLSPRPAEPCRLLTLTDGVSRLLFDEYACHTRSVDGHEETGWILLGRRYGDRALALATIPAGDQSDASSVHVRFDPIVQTVVSRLIRQGQPDLGILGIVHTHPGSLRHPSSGDYRGDIQWVRQLPGAEGIFGIGTADAAYPESLVACQEQPHQHGWGKHRFSWYALSQSDSNYRPLEVSWTLGDDLGECWRKVWPALEVHAPGLNRLATIVPTLHYDIRPGEDQREWLVLTLATGTEEVVQLWLGSSRIRYLLGRGGDYFEADYAEPRVDRGLFHLLSELMPK